MRGPQLEGHGPEYVDPGSNVLLLASTATAGEQETCCELLTPTDPADQNVLVVSFTKTVDECTQWWDRTVGQRPAMLGVVTASDMLRSTAADSFTPVTMQESPVASTVSPEEPVNLGIKVSEFFELCGVSLDDSGERQNVLCFHSLTSLLQYAERDFAFRFLHTLTGLMKSIDAVSHFHLDPNAFEPSTVASVRPLFDEVVDLSSNEVTF